MNTPIPRLSLIGLVVASLGFSTLGCDTEESEPTSNRSATITLEVGGDVVLVEDVSQSFGLQDDLIEASESAPASTCEGTAVDLVLEIEGDDVATISGCQESNVATVGGLTAHTDVQLVSWCLVCDQNGDAFSCCKCAGGSTYWCATQCD